mgnify:FL=1
MLDPEQRAKNLLALATDSDSEESRSAAKIACRFIVEHKLLHDRPSIEDQVRDRVLSLIRSGLLQRGSSSISWVIPPGGSVSEVAENTVEAFLRFLREEEKFDNFPRYTTIQLTEKALNEGAITPDEASIYRRYLLKYLRLQVEQGHLVSKRKWGFGLFDG